MIQIEKVKHVIGQVAAHARHHVGGISRLDWGGPSCGYVELGVGRGCWIRICWMLSHFELSMPLHLQDEVSILLLDNAINTSSL